MDSLAFYNPLTGTTITTLPLGTVAPSSSDDITLRILNNSDLYQAREVSVAVAGDDDVQLWLSTDGDVFTAGIDLGDLAPGGLSQTFWLRRVTGSIVGQRDHQAQLSVTSTGWAGPSDAGLSDNTGLDSE